jgi:hypothetical protein
MNVVVPFVGFVTHLPKAEAARHKAKEALRDAQRASAAQIARAITTLTEHVRSHAEIAATDSDGSPAGGPDPARRAEIESICRELEEFGHRSDSRFPDFHRTWWKLASEGVAVPAGQLEAIAEAYFKADRLDPWYASCA